MSKGKSSNILRGKISHYQQYIPLNYSYTKRYRAYHKSDILDSINSDLILQIFKWRIELWSPTEINHKTGYPITQLYKILSLNSFKKQLCEYFYKHYSTQDLARIILKQLILLNITCNNISLIYNVKYHKMFKVLEWNKSDIFNEIYEKCNNFILQFDLNNLFSKGNNFYTYFINERLVWGFYSEWNFNDKQNKFMDKMGVFLDKEL